MAKAPRESPLSPASLIARVEASAARRVTIAELRDAAARCHGCDLYKHATQVVFGAGRVGRGARAMFVGEQPGDREDLAGEPFVGPAGRMLDDALALAGIERAKVYVTNAVKHFKFEPRGKRRIHKTPMQRHIAACHVWLEGELAREHPAVIVTLGATALAAVYGSRIAIAQARTRKLANAQGTPIVATYHPSAILRVPDHEARVALRATLVGDLVRAARMADRTTG